MKALLAVLVWGLVLAAAQRQPDLQTDLECGYAGNNYVYESVSLTYGGGYADNNHVYENVSPISVGGLSCWSAK